MAARSTGMYPREGFSIDEEMRVPQNVGGTVALLGDLKHAKTIRVIVVGAAITGNGSIRVSFDLDDTVKVDFTTADLDANGVGVAHIRGALLRGKTQDVAYGLIQGTGSSALDSDGGVFLELLDTVRG